MNFTNIYYFFLQLAYCFTWLPEEYISLLKKVRYLLEESIVRTLLKYNEEKC